MSGGCKALGSSWRVVPARQWVVQRVEAAEAAELGYFDCEEGSRAGIVV